MFVRTCDKVDVGVSVINAAMLMTFSGIILCLFSWFSTS